MNNTVENLLYYVNDIANLLEVDDKEVLTALSDFFDDNKFDEIFESALNKL